ncbi:hypothetical protein [Bradyrhizobium canariense]|uniref:CopG family transcriptional regulator n=1 Tax=Bradyrhizobium canariense TaxID=255045 RepID=A0A1X3GN30_9BRAD|nr:hypothetical protein [Bradyrhizobium canariense]OSI68534.1 hypothetical protein BSZ22_20345 [Bradyrhizobium canariense]OSI77981.1 hypothetical protein BSZ23_19345 [Bradyrhizobium canariense]OSI89210.1 hypothetical protein BSZ25_20815 [Bradyrhizobium canariense]OSI93693.1 hypothetical protein BSZ24_12040 [Bradyrhizobium canariense]OSJ03008.1 hypothetical protein BSZ16_16240 [Bradyrhizobium canariense]
MSADGELESNPSSLNQAEPLASHNPTEARRTKKITVHLSESMSERLEAAAGCPGLGKSIVTERALELFLNPEPPIDGLGRQVLDRMSAQLSEMERTIATIAETVALHARYHLTVTPPMQESQQREACLLGQQRFRVLAEQVERRVRLRQPLIEETVDRLQCSGRPPASAPGTKKQLDRQNPSNAAADGSSTSGAAAEEGGSTAYFRTLPNSFCCLGRSGRQ